MAFLDPRHKGKAHAVTLAIVIAILAAGVYRLIQNEMPMMRPDMMALGAVSLRCRMCQAHSDLRRLANHWF